MYLRCRIRHKDACKTLKAEVDLTNQKLAETARSVFKAAEALKLGASDDAKVRAAELRKAAHEAQVLAESSQEIKIIDAAPSNAIFYLMFDRVKVDINGAPFNVGYSIYGYKGFFSTLLKHDRGVKKTLS